VIRYNTIKNTHMEITHGPNKVQNQTLKTIPFAHIRPLGMPEKPGPFPS